MRSEEQLMKLLMVVQGSSRTGIAGWLGLPSEARLDGPWLMWAGTSAAHIMFGEIPPGVPEEYPGR